jgi:hypothetical protein
MNRDMVLTATPGAAGRRRLERDPMGLIQPERGILLTFNNLRLIAVSSQFGFRR